MKSFQYQIGKEEGYVSNVLKPSTKYGLLSFEIDNQQSRVSSLTEKVTEAATALDRREAALTVYYSEVNARIAALQSQQSFLQQQLDVFVKSIYKD